MTQYRKPVPVPDVDTAEYWAAARRHELKIPRCTHCGRLRWPPRPLCPNCYSWDSDWATVSGKGTISSFVVLHHVQFPFFLDDVPYAVIEVTLAEQRDVVLTSNMVNCPNEKLYVGMPVEVVFDDITPEISLPKFRPVIPA